MVAGPLRGEHNSMWFQHYNYCTGARRSTCFAQHTGDHAGPPGSVGSLQTAPRASPDLQSRPTSSFSNKIRKWVMIVTRSMLQVCCMIPQATKSLKGSAQPLYVVQNACFPCHQHNCRSAGTTPVQGLTGSQISREPLL